MAGDTITLLSGRTFAPDAKLVERLDEIASIGGVSRIVGLVDLHLKERTESPSSVAIATDSLVIPKLTSVAQNCGMCLITTGLTRSDLSDERLDELFAHWRRSDYEIFARPHVSLEDMRRIVCTGARAVLDTYGLGPEMLENIEFHGTIGEPELMPWQRLTGIVPRFTLKRARYGFSVIPSGNHFFEVQYVEEIIDREACEKRGLREKDVVIMLHSDGGLLSDDLGNLYANRTTMTGWPKLLYGARKLALHARGVGSASAFAERMRCYFGADKYLSIDPESAEGRRYMTAMRFAMNAGYASRLATVGRLKRVLGAVFPGRRPRIDLLCDFSHNSILRENFEGRSFWVHRHNAARVLPGRLVFLPGYNYTSSYICLGEGGAGDTLYTMDHGAGKTIDRFMKEGTLRRMDEKFRTRAYDNESYEPAMIPHYSDEGIEQVMEILAGRRIARPIARVRPLAGYRFKWKGRLARLRDSLGAGKR